MILTDVLVRPLITEKVNSQMEKSNRYSFEVDRRANKLEIKKAVEEYYGVKVSGVNTIVVPGKSKSRFTKSGFIQGVKGAYKKAVVTLSEGDSIDLFSM
ncbi:MAG: 50S ribosomal protein L23 [Flavipsychrobacter sp.]|nr:50S ribosomal protein L23 [Flavipsychrobacter sp.]